MVMPTTQTLEELVVEYSDKLDIYDAAKIQFDVADFNLYMTENKIVNFLTRNGIKTVIINGFSYILTDGRLIKSTVAIPVI